MTHAFSNGRPCGGRWVMVWSNFRWGKQTTKYIFECSRCWEQGFASSR